MEIFPQISIIVPVYNGEKYIKKCLDSLVCQKCLDLLEIVIINDGSTDSSGEILDTYQKKYPSNINVYTTTNKGVSEARNYGVEKANGNYITFVDADDWIDADCYTNVLELIKNTPDIICTGYIVELNNEKQIINAVSDKLSYLNSYGAMKKFLKGTIDVHVCTKLFKKSLIENIKFDSQLKVAEDRVFTCESIALSRNVVLTDNTYYHYFQNTHSVMHEGFSEKRLDAINAEEKIIEIVEEYYPQLSPYAECMMINAKCRILGELHNLSIRENYNHIYKNLRKEVFQFSLLKSIKYSTKKHWLALLIAKIHPGIYNRIRGNETIKFNKG